MTTESAAPKAHIEKFQRLLRELFQFDSTDLDFGIYRIMNYKRDAVEKFIAEDLPKVISDDLDQGVLAEQDRADAELAETAQKVMETLSEDAIDADGELVSFQNTTLGKEYLKARARAAGSRSREAIEIDIFNHLYAFFSSYYEDGDFISKRRYAKRQQYAIPYNGEEVHLHWANRDQYYVKTGEHFRDYDWKVPNGIAVHFRIEAADVEQNNVKGDKRFFLPLVEGTNYDASNRAIAIPFEYRPLTETEIETYGKQKQQDKIIAAAVDAIPKRLGTATDALAALTGERYRNGKDESVSHLAHHLLQYTRRNSSDFFIHKDLKGFLSRELDFYLKNEVLDLGEMTAIGEHVVGGYFQILRVIKAVGGQIIDFLDQIECFQKMLWEKRKFITETQHCIAVGTIDESFYPAIATCEAQWAEWKALCHIDEDAVNLFNSGKNRQGKRVAFMQAHPTLVLDTRHFDADFTDRLLASFDDLDGMTDGLLIHSENYQALNLLREKYAEQVKCIYIDPPYNTSASEIIYRNGYKHSSWLSLMENRVSLSTELMQGSTILTIAIDENEMERLGFLLDGLFPLHSKTCVSVIHNPGGIQGDNFSYNNEFAYFVYPAAKGRYIGMQKRDDNPDIRPLRDVSTGDHLRADAANCFYPIYVKEAKVIGFGDVCEDSFHPSGVNVDAGNGMLAVYPIDAQGNERKWVFSRQSVEGIKDELAAEWNKSRKIWDIIRRKTHFNYKTVWQSKRYNANSYGSKLLRDILGNRSFQFPKSVHTVADCVQLSTYDTDNAIVLDYFAGSGTTGHAVINLNREDGGRRKFILVEMGEYFDTVLLPRIKKIAFTPEWRDGKPKRVATPEEAERSPRIVKYMRVESYEDALNNIAFDDAAAQLNLAARFDDYLIKYMLQWETKDSATLLNVKKLTRPFTYRLRVHANGETQERMADIPETFNYLLGLNVRTRRVYEAEGRRYLIYRGETRDAPGRDVAVIWRETEGWERADYDRDRRFVADQGLADGADAVYVNGDSCIPRALAIAPMFKARMFAEVER